MMLLNISFLLVIHCSDPGVPINGHRVMEDTGIGAIATYYCNPGYRLVGEASIVCLNIGHWSRAKPLCRKIGKEYCVLMQPSVYHYACVHI